MYKKIVTIVLAVMILVPVFIMPTSAIETGQIGFIVNSDAKIGMAVNDVITVQVFYTAHSDQINTLKLATGAFVVAYDGTYLSYVDGSRIYGDAYSFFKHDSMINTGIWSVIGTGVNGNTNDTAKGYSNAVLFNSQFQTGVPEGATGFNISQDCPFLTFKLKVTKAIDKEVYIGVPDSTLTKQTVINKKEGTKTVKCTLDQMDNTNAFRTSNFVSVNFATTTKVRRNADNAALVDLGFTGSFLNAGIPIDFAGGRSTNVSAVGVELTVNGVTNEYQDNFVYENAGGNGYNFRVALTGIPAANFDTPIKARMFVVYDGDTYYSDYVYTTAAAHVGRLS